MKWILCSAALTAMICKLLPLLQHSHHAAYTKCVTVEKILFKCFLKYLCNPAGPLRFKNRSLAHLSGQALTENVSSWSSVTSVLSAVTKAGCKETQGDLWSQAAPQEIRMDTEATVTYQIASHTSKKPSNCCHLAQLAVKIIWPVRINYDKQKARSINQIQFLRPLLRCFI